MAYPNFEYDARRGRIHMYGPGAQQLGQQHGRGSSPALSAGRRFSMGNEMTFFPPYDERKKEEKEEERRSRPGSGFNLRWFTSRGEGTKSADLV